MIARDQRLGRRSSLKGLIGLLAFLGLFLRVATVASGEVSLTEYQVKALFLLNFAKYVDWPAASFAETNTPIVIGLCGEDKFGDALKKAVEGKSVSGRGIVIQPIEKDADLAKCHLLFISDSEKKRLADILAKTKAVPVLTVGESDQFLEQGGVINFVKKEGKIRLEINLDAARLARLEISSKLLGVADVVKGKRNQVR
jgi:hypothetical protein